MRQRICKVCGLVTIKELTSKGPKYFCKDCNDYPMVDELDMNPHCPECGDQVEMHVKCGTGFYCNKCRRLLSSKNIAWKDATS